MYSSPTHLLDATKATWVIRELFSTHLAACVYLHRRRIRALTQADIRRALGVLAIGNLVRAGTIHLLSDPFATYTPSSSLLGSCGCALLVTTLGGRRIEAFMTRGVGLGRGSAPVLLGFLF